jgi:predicted dehydrogenase
MIKIAFIGAGNMATEHLKVFSSISEVNLCGIFSRTKEKSEQLAIIYPDLKIYNSIADLYLNEKPDLVVISVPELATESVCKMAFQYPWICLIEKPVGYNLENATIILDEARRTGVKAYVALNRRHYSSTVNVMEQMSETKQPRVIHIYDQEAPKAAFSAGQPALVVENWMYANSIHLIDYFSILGRGKIISVQHVVPWNAENPFHICTKIVYDSGDIGIYEAVWNAPGPWSVIVNTPEKRWEMRPLEKAVSQLNGSRKQDPIELHTWDKEFKPGLRLQAEEAIKAVKGLAHKLPTLEDAYESMKLTKEIYFGNK